MKIVISLFLLVTGFFFLMVPTPQAPCANTGSCLPSTAVIEQSSVGTFLGQRITVPPIDTTQDDPLVLGMTTGPNDKHIYVDLATQTLYAYEGAHLFFQTLVSTGKWFPTPPGDYTIWVKLRATRMSGGEGNDAYDLPNVPYVMFFYNDTISKARGFSLHGAYWHNNFGHPMSHGCVNMREVDAHKIYDWVNPVTITNTTYSSADDPGTPVSICSSISTSIGGTPQCVE